MPHVHALRGGLLESRHRVHLAVVRPDGSLFASVGDPRFESFMRSSAKAFQALPLVPVMDRLGLEPRHLAVALASHAGERVHVDTVADLLERVGVSPDALVCGVHAPFSDEARAELRAAGQRPNVLHNNCSGKHSGMLASSVGRAWPTAGYADAEHPLQRLIAQGLCDLTGLETLEVGVDGCSVPSFRVPLHLAALAFAKVAAPEAAGEHAEALEVAFQAMREHPYLVAGGGRLDTVLMQHLPGVGSKIGAEAYMGLMLRETPHGPLGVAIKIEDGHERALGPAALETLRQLGLVGADDGRFLGFSNPVLRNVAKLEVGELRAAFELKLAAA